MKSSWSRTILPIASIFSFRMLGLFMLIPVFSLYAQRLNGATPALIGLALGAYGLSQGLLQIPFGLLSDRFGRKPLILIGLIMFAFGSLIGALSESVYGMILARCLQGMGAVGSVLIALLADLTDEKKRTGAMAVVGMFIGLSFALAMVISPPITRHFGLSGIFYFSLMLALVGIAVVLFIILNPKRESFHAESETSWSLLPAVLKQRSLLTLDFGIFCQHFILTATFFEIPLLLHQQMNAGHLSAQWLFYLPVMLLSFLLMVPFIILAEKKRKMKSLFSSAIWVIALSQCLLIFCYQSWWLFVAAMFFYFVAFNFLEASLPSLVSKQVNSNLRGTAMGVYSSSQFFGIFAGGSLAGTTYTLWGAGGIFIINALLAVLWVGAAGRAGLKTGRSNA